MNKNSVSKKTLLSLMTLALVAAGLPLEAAAGPHRAKGEAKTRVNKNSGNRNSGNKTVVNNSRHNNVNVDRDVNINVDNNHHGRGRYDNDYHPIATAAAVTATVAVTSAVVGAILQPNQMASNCVQVMNRNMAYMQCGSTWYQPQYQGSNVSYIVVNAPY